LNSEEGRKNFFFEKKKQKTLILHRALLPGQGLMSRDASLRWHDGIFRSGS